MSDDGVLMAYCIKCKTKLLIDELVTHMEKCDPAAHQDFLQMMKRMNIPEDRVTETIERVGRKAAVKLFAGQAPEEAILHEAEELGTKILNIIRTTRVKPQVMTNMLYGLLAHHYSSLIKAGIVDYEHVVKVTENHQKLLLGDIKARI